VSIVVGKHSTQRTKDRVGISKKLADKNAQRAFECGITHSETRGSLKRYIDGLYLSHQQGNNIRIYHRYVYIFQRNRLITILPLPRKYYDLADKLQKSKEVDGHVDG